MTTVPTKVRIILERIIKFLKECKRVEIYRDISASIDNTYILHGCESIQEILGIQEVSIVEGIAGQVSSGDGIKTTMVLTVAG